MTEKENDRNLRDDKNDCCQYTLDLQKCLSSISKEVLQKISDDKFIQIYKQCYREFDKKQVLEKAALSGSSVEAKKYLAQFNSMVTKTLLETIDQTVMAMNENLRELEELKKAQSENGIAWRPPGNVAQHMIPFEYICEMERKKELESGIRKEQEALILLKSRLHQKRLKANECHKTILSTIGHIKSLVTVKNNADTMEVEKEIKYF